MRVEKRKAWVAFIMAFVLLLSLPAVYTRVLFASDEIGWKIIDLTKERGSVCDRLGTVITDVNHTAPSCMANLIGVDNYTSNGIINCYEDKLMPQGFQPLIGLDSIQDMKGCQITTTLLPTYCQEAIAEVFGSTRGSVFAFNYRTGEIYVALSLPSSYQEPVKGTAEEQDGRFLNTALVSARVPGSTMKIVTLVTALQQKDVDLLNLKNDCDGHYELPDGKVVDCTGMHGEIGIVEAVRKSCNCYFAKVATLLDVEQTQEILSNLGVYTSDDVEQKFIDALSRASSTTTFDTNTLFSDVWGMIGQGETEMCSVDMAMIAGAIANDGKVAQPYLIESITDPNKKDKVVYEGEAENMQKLLPKKIAQTAQEIWSEAYSKATYSDTSAHTTYAKTGTVQLKTDARTIYSRSLLGVMEEYDCAYFIYVEDVDQATGLCHEIADCLDDQMAAVFS